MKKLLILIAVLAVLLPLNCFARPLVWVEIIHNIPEEVGLYDIPFTAIFTAETANVISKEVSYYAIQYNGNSGTTYMPNGVISQDFTVDLDLRKKSTTVLVAVANPSGDITRLELKVTLNTDCPGCDLSWYGPSNSGHFMGIDFSYANLSGASMRNLDVQYTDFSYANLIGTDFSSDMPSETKLHGVIFVGADLKWADFSDTYIIQVDFTDANLEGADFMSSPEIERCIWSNTICPDGTNSDDNGGTCINNLGVE